MAKFKRSKVFKPPEFKLLQFHCQSLKTHIKLYRVSCALLYQDIRIVHAVHNCLHNNSRLIIFSTSFVSPVIKVAEGETWGFPVVLALKMSMSTEIFSANNLNQN
jgi:hypothetical protein